MPQRDWRLQRCSAYSKRCCGIRSRCCKRECRISEEQKATSAFNERFPALAVCLNQVSLRGPGVADYAAVISRSTDWDALVSRWLEGIDLEANTVYAVAGFGNGFHIAAPLDRLPDSSFIFCAEPQAEAICKMVDSERAESLFSDPRFYPGVGDLDADFFESCRNSPPWRSRMPGLWYLPRFTICIQNFIIDSFQNSPNLWNTGGNWLAQV